MTHQRASPRVPQHDDRFEVWELGAVGQGHEEQVEDGKGGRRERAVLDGRVSRKSFPRALPPDVVALFSGNAKVNSVSHNAHISQAISVNVRQTIPPMCMAHERTFENHR